MFEFGVKNKYFLLWFVLINSGMLVVVFFVIVFFGLVGSVFGLRVGWNNSWKRFLFFVFWSLLVVLSKFFVDIVCSLFNWFLLILRICKKVVVVLVVFFVVIVLEVLFFMIVFWNRFFVVGIVSSVVMFMLLVDFLNIVMLFGLLLNVEILFCIYFSVVVWFKRLRLLEYVLLNEDKCKNLNGFSW